MSALTAYHWVYRESVKPWLVADLLILNRQMPRSLANCYEILVRHLDLIAEAYGRAARASGSRATCWRSTLARRIEAIFEQGCTSSSKSSSREQPTRIRDRRPVPHLKSHARPHRTHETVYDYERPVGGLIQILRLTPRDHDGQHVRSWRIEPSVDGRLKRGEDTFGNIVHIFSADGSVEELTIRVTGEVETNETHGVVRGAVERVPDIFYLRESSLARCRCGDPRLYGTPWETSAQIGSPASTGWSRPCIAR